jgi:hypothetical protein
LEEGEIFRAALGGREREYIPNLAIRCFQLEPDDELTSEAYWFANVVSLQVNPPLGYDELRKGVFDTPHATIFWVSYTRSFEEADLTLSIVQYFIVHQRCKYLISFFVTPFDYDELIESLHGIVASISFA